MTGAFFERNGFAMRRDLEHPMLRELLAECRRENGAFSGVEKAALSWSRQWEYPYVLAHLPRGAAGRRVLDAGCGFRFFTSLLARRGFRVDACDLDAGIGPRLAEIAEREGLPIRFSRQDLTRLSYESGGFDVICCISVLEHTADPEAVVDEFSRCLRPGGRLLLTFDVSVRGDRDIPIDASVALVELLERRFAPAWPFAGRELLDAKALAASEEVLRTEWFRRHRPELLPWRFVSRAGLRNLLRGRIGRPFFDLAVVGLVLEKPTT